MRFPLLFYGNMETPSKPFALHFLCLNLQICHLSPSKIGLKTQAKKKKTPSSGQFWVLDFQNVSSNVLITMTGDGSTPPHQALLRTSQVTGNTATSIIFFSIRFQLKIPKICLKAKKCPVDIDIVIVHKFQAYFFHDKRLSESCTPMHTYLSMHWTCFSASCDKHWSALKHTCRSGTIRPSAKFFNCSIAGFRDSPPNAPNRMTLHSSSKWMGMIHVDNTRQWQRPGAVRVNGHCPSGAGGPGLLIESNQLKQFNTQIFTSAFRFHK